ncbi:MAG: PD-(D/E)XK nuclease family protein [Deltaproteobacteria bacterium]|nr:PD-(D/E)XK nuclease family protein [Deltaproteobacteria bacterium]
MLEPGDRPPGAIAWPHAGAWYAVVRGEPLAVAARMLAIEHAGAPLSPGGACALVPDVRTAASLRAWTRALGGVAAARADRVVAAGLLAERLLEPEELAPPAGELVLDELSRAVDFAIRANPEAFPRLCAFAPGAGLPTALGRLFGDLRAAGLESRDAGAVATLERLDPPGLGQELLQAMGMFEGRLDALGWWDLPARQRAAARRVDRAPPGPWLVVGFGHIPGALLELIDRLAAARPVLFLLAAGEETPHRDAQAPDRRSVAFAGAAPWRDFAALASRVDPPEAGRVTQVLRLPDPASVAARAVELAEAHGATALLAVDPERWRVPLDEAARRRGHTLTGDHGPASPAPVLRLIAGLVEACAGELSAAQAVDLLDLGARTGLPGYPADPLAGDRADARLRRAGVTRGRDAVLGALGPLGRPLARALERLDAAPDAATQLRVVAGLIADADLHRLAGLGPAIAARADADQLAQLRALLEDLASRLPLLWPQSSPRATPELLLARVRAAIASSLPSREQLVPPEGPQAGPPVHLQALDAPLPPWARQAILLGVAEGDLVPRGAASHLIPDRVRASGPVATEAHWPWHADTVTMRRRRLEALLAGRLVRELVSLEPERDLRGAEHVRWAALPVATAEPAAVRRSARLWPPEVPAEAPPAPLLARVGLGAPAGLAATRVDAYRDCPRRFYYEHLLGTADREALGYDIDPRQRGTWLHGVLRRLFFEEPRWWADAPEPAEVRALLARRVDPAQAALTAGASDAFVALQAERYLDGVAEALSAHGAVLAACADQRPAGFELAVRARWDGAGGAPLVLRGTLDRLDLVMGPGGRAEAFMVIDYKTGAVADYGAAATPDSRRVQLFLYAWVAREVLGIPCRGVYAVPVLEAGRPRGAVVPGQGSGAWESVGHPREILDADALEQLMVWALETAREAARGMSAGAFPAVPARGDLCARCPHSLYCPRERR